MAQNPRARIHIEHLDTQDPHYLAGEFLTADWRPIYATQAFSAFAESKLDFVGSATIGENRLLLCVPQDLIPLVANAPDAGFRELLKDYALNKAFRRDVYAKGPHVLSSDQARRDFERTTFVLLGPADPVPDTWRVPSGEATITRATLDVLVSTLRDGPASGKALLTATAAKEIAAADVMLALEVLVHNRLILPGVDPALLDPAPARRLNEVVLNLAEADDTHRYLAVPALGSAIGVDVIDRNLMSLLRRHGETDAAVIAGLLFDRLEKSGRSLTKDGKPLGRDAAGIGEIARSVERLRSDLIPRWRTLGLFD